MGKFLDEELWNIMLVLRFGGFCHGYFPVEGWLAKGRIRSEKREVVVKYYPCGRK